MAILRFSFRKNARRLLCAIGVFAVCGIGLPSQAQVHERLPIIFVHGQSGSAQQFETQAMRFTSNDYPQELLFAFEYDTSVGINPITDLDQFIDGVLERTGAEQVYAIGHSRGTTVWTGYLEDQDLDGPDKVARYVNIDGRSPADFPGGVPTIGIWGEWNTADSGYNRRGNTNAQIGPDPAANYYFGTKSHTEVATSADAFAVMYEFLTGRVPATTAVIPEPPGSVRIAGRAVIFPENIGYDGATVELWRVDGETGQRIGKRAHARFPIDESGAFGPVKVNGLKHYELAVHRPAANGEPDTVHHFYFEPFSRSDFFLRLNTSRPGDGLEAFLPRDPRYTNLVISRQKEFWGDQGSSSDALEIDGLNVLTDRTSPRAGVNLAFFAYDAGPPLPPPFPPFPGPPDGATDLDRGELFPFNTLTFLTAADVSISASPDASGTVSVTDQNRGGPDRTTINLPNWPSDVHRITVQFRDDDPAVQRFTNPELGSRGGNGTR
ncbi:alpha/beta hydrolase [Lentisalinibacter salinarum]|uniref:alpha/beta hydrolase n=1 Tax=Lentisalinibacter salinarum TaxID=2992239 RepID=UPI003866B0CB